MRPTVTPALLSGKESLAMTVPLNRFLVMGAAALTFLVAILATGYAVYAQSGDYSCAAGEAVADPDNNPGLVSDCTALLAAQDSPTWRSWTCDATSLPAPSPPGSAASSTCRTCTSIIMT